MHVNSGEPPPGHWDGHSDHKLHHEYNSNRVDQPVAALLQDLRQRGLLEDTLVVFTTEFGRTPTVQGGWDRPGRDHNNLGFTVWLAGGGTAGGRRIGATDDIGWRAVENPYSVHDFHATMLHALGIDNEALSYEHSGRLERLTGPAGIAKPIEGEFT